MSPPTGKRDTTNRNEPWRDQLQLAGRVTRSGYRWLVHRWTQGQRPRLDDGAGNDDGREVSLWEEQDVEAAVLEALHELGTDEDGGHHFGRPYVTAYQLAIAVQAAHPEIAAALGVTVGGRGTGAPTSLAQYLARELSGRIKRNGDGYPVEGAFISNEHLTALTYVDASGQPITSSLTGSGYDLSLFRARAVAQ